MVPMSHVLIVSAILFSLGLCGVLWRRNLLIVLMSIELMLNAANMVFIGFSRLHAALQGQAFVFMVVALVAAEASVGLAIVVAVFRSRRTINADEINLMRH